MMSEKLLMSLIQLFAIIAKLDFFDLYSRSVVLNFLASRLSQDEAERYIIHFDRHLIEMTKANEGKAVSNRLSVKDNARVLLICSQINQELTQADKIAILVVVFDLISANDEISAGELDLVTTMGDVLNIAQHEYQMISDFAMDKTPSEINEPYFLTFNSIGEGYGKVIAKPDLQGTIRLLHLPSINNYIIKYKGKAKYWLNAQSMPNGRIFNFTTGSILRGAKLAPIYFSDVVAAFSGNVYANPIVFEVKDIAYQFVGGKVGLHPFSMTEESGNLVGIMGPSGAGKSTLLELLNGTLTPSKGNILINGVDLTTEKDKLEGYIGYVPQDDLLIEDLSVYENLFYAAKLSLAHLNTVEINEVVNQTLESLAIKDISHLKVGNPLSKTISGGERKRVNIALELLRQPSILFLDEPTSGLSSRNSLSIMDLLKQLTLTNKLIFVVIHQPSSDIFKMLDKLVILDTGGYPIYYGNPVEAIGYFKERVNQIRAGDTVCPECGNVNPEQIFDIIETKVVNEFGRFTNKRRVTPEAWNLYYREFLQKTKPKREIVFEKAHTNIANQLQQWLVFISRDVKAKLRNKQYLLVNALQTPLLALVLAFVNRYYDTTNPDSEYSLNQNSNIPVYFFMSIIVALFTGLIISAEEIYHDRKILKREKFLKLSRLSYLFSKVSVLFTLSAIQMLVFVLIGNYVLEIEGITIMNWLVMFSLACFANTLGLNISSAFNSAVTIYILIPILLIPQLILGGIVIKYDKLNPLLTDGYKVPFIGQAMASRWGFEAIMVHQFMENPYNKPFYGPDSRMANAEFKKNFLIPELQAKLEGCYMLTLNSDENQQQQLTSTLDAVRLFLIEEGKQNPKYAFPQANLVTTTNFEPKLGEAVNAHLLNLKTLYVEKFNQANADKQRILNQMISKVNGAEQLQYLQKTYQNTAINDLVLYKDAETHVWPYNNSYVEKSNPIYNAPTPSGYLDFSAQMFTPVVWFMGRYWPTPWFNLAVVWAMSGLLFLNLQFNGLKKFVDFCGRSFGRPVK